MPAYRSLVDELTRGARERTVRAARDPDHRGPGRLGKRGRRAGGTLAEEVGQASRANRELFEQVFAAEVGRAAGRVGLVPQADLREALDRAAEPGRGPADDAPRDRRARHAAGEVPALRRELASDAAGRDPRGRDARRG